MIALFMAGGSGTRLWPLSRENNPKQLQKLIDSKSLITQTVDRLDPLIDPEDIWIVTNENYRERISEHCPTVPKEQIITEPFPLGTNLAVGLGLIHIAAQNPDEIVVIGWADSYIGREDEFRRVLQKAQLAAAEAEGVILGVKADYPATGYGYLEKGRQFFNHQDVYHILRFEEKPNLELAEQFFKSGVHYWNPGISVWKVSSLLQLIKKYTPDHYAALEYVAYALSDSEEAIAGRMASAFKNLDRIAIDKAIFEKAENLVTIPSDLQWSDIGSWSAIYDVQTQDKQEKGNITRGTVISVDTDKCLIYAQKRLVATLGISDLVIIETADAVLIAKREDSDRLKELHAQVIALGGVEYL